MPEQEYEKGWPFNPDGQSSTKPKDMMSQIDGEGLLGLFRSRRSIRRYRAMKPPLPVIDKVIDCASYSPSAHNAQPWRFFVIENENKRTKLISEMGKKYQKDLQRDKVKESTIENRLRRSKQLFSEAPLLMIACIDMSVMDKYPDAERQQAEMIMATQSLAAAIENLLLAATALGLGGCWFCAPLFCPEVVRSILVLPDYQIPQALITLGYPAENPLPPPRLDLEDIRFIL